MTSLAGLTALGKFCKREKKGLPISIDRIYLSFNQSSMKFFYIVTLLTGEPLSIGRCLKVICVAKDIGFPADKKASEVGC